MKYGAVFRALGESESHLPTPKSAARLTCYNKAIDFTVRVVPGSHNSNPVVPLTHCITIGTTAAARLPEIIVDASEPSTDLNGSKKVML